MARMSTKRRAVAASATAVTLAVVLGISAFASADVAGDSAISGGGVM